MSVLYEKTFTINNIRLKRYTKGRQVQGGLAAGAGGIIRHPGRHIIFKFTWDLGVMTNNEAETYVLFEGTRLALSNGIGQITICRDSMTLIKAIVTQNITGGNTYTDVISQIPALLPNLKASYCITLSKNTISLRTNKQRKELA